MCVTVSNVAVVKAVNKEAKRELEPEIKRLLALYKETKSKKTKHKILHQVNTLQNELKVYRDVENKISTCAISKEESKYDETYRLISTKPYKGVVMEFTAVFKKYGTKGSSQGPRTCFSSIRNASTNEGILEHCWVHTIKGMDNLRTGDVVTFLGKVGSRKRAPQNLFGLPMLDVAIKVIKVKDR